MPTMRQYLLSSIILYLVIIPATKDEVAFCTTTNIRARISTGPQHPSLNRYETRQTQVLCTRRPFSLNDVVGGTFACDEIRSNYSNPLLPPTPQCAFPEGQRLSDKRTHTSAPTSNSLSSHRPLNGASCRSPASPQPPPPPCLRCRCRARRLESSHSLGGVARPPCLRSRSRQVPLAHPHHFRYAIICAKTRSQLFLKSQCFACSVSSKICAPGQKWMGSVPQAKTPPRQKKFFKLKWYPKNSCDARNLRPFPPPAKLQRY